MGRGSLLRIATAMSVVLMATVLAPGAEASAAPQLAFVTEGQLFTVGADGKGLRELPAWDPTDVSHAAWSKTDRIVYTRETASPDLPTERWEIRKIDPRTATDRKVASIDGCCPSTPVVTAAAQWIDPPPVWSPDGGRAAFTLWTCVNSFVWGLGCYWETQIYVVDADGSGLKALPGTVDGFDPAWSPDGKRIAFNRVATIEVIDATTGAIPTLVSPPGVTASYPRWSPDGKRIAFVGRKAAEVLNVGRIYVATADGKSARSLPAFTTEPPSWSPDSKYLTYSDATRGEGWDGIMTIRADGKLRTRLTSYPDKSWDHWVGVGSPQWSPDGSRIAFIRSESRWNDSPSLPGSLWTIDPKTPFKARRIANVWDSYPTFTWRSR